MEALEQINGMWVARRGRVCCRRTSERGIARRGQARRASLRVANGRAWWSTGRAGQGVRWSCMITEVSEQERAAKDKAGKWP